MGRIPDLRKPDVQAKTSNSRMSILEGKVPIPISRNLAIKASTSPLSAHCRLPHVGVRRRCCNSLFPEAEHSAAKCRRSTLGSWALRPRLRKAVGGFARRKIPACLVKFYSIERQAENLYLAGRPTFLVVGRNKYFETKVNAATFRHVAYVFYNFSLIWPEFWQ